MKNTCVYCGTFIVEASQVDPFVCYDCESIMDRNERMLELI